MTTKGRLPAYKRRPQDKRTKMQVTTRDITAWLLMYRYGGFITVDQYAHWFYPNNDRNAHRRISKMFHQGYIDRLKPDQRFLVPEPIVWLDEGGLNTVAIQLGQAVEALVLPQKPKFFCVPHDILLNEVLFALDQSFMDDDLALAGWMHQHQLNKTFTQKVSFLDIKQQVKEKRVIPDYYLNLALGGQNYHFLVELDNDSEHTGRLVDEKVLANLHLLMSTQYANQIGVNAGRILLISTASATRLANIRALTAQAGASQYCLVVSYDELVNSNPLRDVVWQLPHSPAKVSLVDYVTPQFTEWLKQDVYLKDLPDLTLYRS